MKAKGLLATLALMAGGVAPLTAQTETADTLYTSGYEMLDELVIEAERPVMQTDGAKLTYNVEEDPAADSSNVLDILRKIPQVSVDGDGNIRLNGSNAFKLQINGMENPMLKQYSGQILQAMPAASIAKVEVITEPGAKEDAEGVAGIINIITERTRSKDGYGGKLNLQVGNRTLTPSLYAIAKKNKVTASANINYQWGFLPQKFEQQTSATYLTPGNEGTLTSLIRQESKHQYVGGNLNFSWEPNPDNLFTAGADLTYVTGNVGGLNGTSRMYAPDGNLLWSFTQTGGGRFRMMNVSANASYRHNFGHDGNSLILSYLFNFGKTTLGLDRHYAEYTDYQPAYEYENQDSREFNRGHTAQIDYSNNFNSKHHQLDIGAKGIFRRNTALSDYLYGNLPDMIVVHPDESNNIVQPQNIYAGYASYTGSYGSFGVTAGVRNEHTLMGITDRKDSSRSFRNRLNDWVPNAALVWNKSNTTNLRLAYQMRISRPSIQQVNPFQLTFSPYEMRQGNPDLSSERSHIISLKYTSFGRAVGGSAGLEYNLTDNAISGLTYLWQHDGINTVVTTFANLGKTQNVAFTGFLNWGIIKNMNLSFNGRLAYNMLSAPTEGYRHKGWSGSIGASWNYSVANVYKFGAYGSWNSRSITIQGYSPGFFYYGISASRDFLANKSLTLSVSANNFLQKTMKFKSFSHTHDVIHNNVSRMLNTWNVGVSLSWNFGSATTQVKKTGVELNNDDINSSSNKGQGGAL